MLLLLLCILLLWASSSPSLILPCPGSLVTITDCPAKPLHRLLLPGTMCSIPTVVIIYKLVLSWLSFICLFSQGTVSFSKITCLFSLDQSIISVFCWETLLLMDVCCCLPIWICSLCPFYCCRTALLFSPTSWNLQIKCSSASLFSFWLSNFAAIVFNTLLCCHMYLLTSNATGQADNMCCRVAGLSVQRMHIGSSIKPPLQAVDWVW